MPNDTGEALTRVFVGSAGEALDLAHRVAEEMKNRAVRTSPHIKVVVRSWDYTFQSADITYPNLLECAQQYAFGVFVFTPDDNIEKNGKRHAITRDNVIFELGIWAGANGIDHAHVLKADSPSLNMPLLTDLKGFVAQTFTWSSDGADLESLDVASGKVFDVIVKIAHEERASEGSGNQVMAGQRAAELLLLQQLQAKLRDGDLAEGSYENLKQGMLVISRTYGLGDVIAVGDRLVRVDFSDGGERALLHSEVALAKFEGLAPH